jgi:exopolysaccharide biosynthesis predicted pyruvyltransferase EpsI
MKTLECVLTELSSQQFIFVEPGGNWGDYLIYYGAKVLAKKLGLEFESLTIKEFLERGPDGANIYVHGGGGFNEWCSGAAFVCLQHALTHYEGCIVYGPCTTSMNEDFLDKNFAKCLQNRKAKSFTIFARENTTFDIFKRLSSFNVGVNTYIDHDTAFHVTPEDVFTRIGESRDDYCLYGYRKDNESSEVKHIGNMSKIVLDPPMYAKSFDHWLRIHAYANEIITNRTHSSIIGAILGKETSLFASKYHKNRSVWEYSMQSTSVTWVSDDIALSISKRGFWMNFLPNKLHTSSKVQKIVNLFKSIPKE